MENISTLSDKFSWRRMMSIGLLYRNPMRLYLAVAALISALCYLGMQCVRDAGLNILGFYTTASFIVGAVLYLSPITFTRCDSTLMTLLPAKASEKWAFYLIYVLIIVPAVVQGVWYLLNFSFSLVSEDYNLTYLMYKYVKFDCSSISSSNKIFFFAISIIQSIAILVTVLLIVLSSQSHRIIKAVLGLVGVIFLTGVLSAISGFVAAIKNLTDLTPDENPFLIFDKMRPIFTFLYGIVFCYSVYISWYLYRRIARGQIKA